MLKRMLYCIRVDVIWLIIVDIDMYVVYTDMVVHDKILTPKNPLNVPKLW
jgi:hypothetical protein